MTVASLKRLLSLLNAAAVLGLAGTAWGFYQHRRDLAAPERPVDFDPPVRSIGGGSASIDHLDMRLGRYLDPSATARPAEAEAAPKEEQIETVLEKLGTIRGAVIASPPYTDAQPTIIFEYKQKPPGATSNTVVIRLNEALEMKPDPDPRRAAAGAAVPSRYKFVGCEPDPQNPGWAIFLFDMKCDGTDIQKARWKGDLEKRKIVADAAGAAGPQALGPGKIYIGPRADDIPAEPAPRVPPPPVATPPPPSPGVQPVQPVAADRVPDQLFGEEGGVLAPTAEGIEYLRANQDRILEEVRTSDYVDSRTGQAGGVQILRVPRNSAASRFGILEDDVIQAINGIPVRNRSQAIQVVKDELRKQKTLIVVQLLRGGRQIVKTYDTRDPATRRAAKGLR
jgi:hypothetical protein